MFRDSSLAAGHSTPLGAVKARVPPSQCLGDFISAHLLGGGGGSTVTHSGKFSRELQVPGTAASATSAVHLFFLLILNKITALQSHVSLFHVYGEDTARD